MDTDNINPKQWDSEALAGNIWGRKVQQFAQDISPEMMLISQPLAGRRVISPSSVLFTCCYSTRRQVIMVFISQVRNERCWQLNEFLRIMWGAERVSSLGHPMWAQEVRKMPAPGKMRLNSAAAHVKACVNQICPWNKRLPTIASSPNPELDLFASQVLKIF